MYMIGENIHIISPRVKEALTARDGAFFTDLARRQVDAGAQALDLNIGPRKKDGPEVMEWLVDQVCAGAPNAVFSLDTTNLAAIEAGLKKIPRGRAIINSTSAAPERMETVPPRRGRWGSRSRTSTRSARPRASSPSSGARSTSRPTAAPAATPRPRPTIWCCWPRTTAATRI